MLIAKKHLFKGVENYFTDSLLGVASDKIRIRYCLFHICICTEHSDTDTDTDISECEKIISVSIKIGYRIRIRY